MHSRRDLSKLLINDIVESLTRHCRLWKRHDIVIDAFRRIGCRYYCPSLGNRLLNVSDLESFRFTARIITYLAEAPRGLMLALHSSFIRHSDLVIFFSAEVVVRERRVDDCTLGRAFPAFWCDCERMGASFACHTLRYDTDDAFAPLRH